MVLDWLLESVPNNPMCLAYIVCHLVPHPWTENVDDIMNSLNVQQMLIYSELEFERVSEPILVYQSRKHRVCIIRPPERIAGMHVEPDGGLSTRL